MALTNLGTWEALSVGNKHNFVNLTKYILMASITCFSTTQLKAESIDADGAGNFVLDLSSYARDQVYLVSVKKNVIPKKMSGNPFKDSSLRVSCDNIELANTSRRINPNEFGKQIEFSTSFMLSESSCPNFKVIVTADFAGNIVESKTIEYDVATKGINPQRFYERIKLERESKGADLLRVAGKLAEYAGSQQALFCLISKYEGDIIFTGVVEELERQYSILYGDIEREKFDCTSNATGLLASNISYCRSNPSNLEPFCLLLNRYDALLSWYESTQTKILEVKSGILDSNSQIYSELEKISLELSIDKNSANDLISNR